MVMNAPILRNIDDPRTFEIVFEVPEETVISVASAARFTDIDNALPSGFSVSGKSLRGHWRTVRRPAKKQGEFRVISGTGAVSVQDRMKAADRPRL